MFQTGKIFGVDGGEKSAATQKPICVTAVHTSAAFFCIVESLLASNAVGLVFTMLGAALNCDEIIARF